MERFNVFIQKASLEEEKKAAFFFCHYRLVNGFPKTVYICYSLIYNSIIILKKLFCHFDEIKNLNEMMLEICQNQLIHIFIIL